MIEPSDYHSVADDDFPLIVDAWSMLAYPDPEPKALIEGLLHKGFRMSIGGGSKTYKTWVIIDLALSIACGVPWLGRKCYQGKVLYLNMELSSHYFGKRMEVIKKAKGIELTPDRLDVWNLRGRCQSYTKFIPKILKEMKTSAYDLIIFDPIYKLLGDADENKAGDITDMMNTFEDLSQRTAAATVFASHFSKGNQADRDPMDRISGSGVFGRDPDVVMTITRHKSAECFTVQSTVRNTEPVEPFAIRWQKPLMVVDEFLNPDDLLKKRENPMQKFSSEELLKLLPDEGMSTGEWQKAALAKFEMSRPSFNRHRQLLEKRHLITHDGKLWKPFKIEVLS